MDFDKVLEKCGNFGRYQFLLLFLFGYTNVLSSLHYFSQTLISFTPEHWCYHDKLVNYTYQEIKELYQKQNVQHCSLIEDVLNGTQLIIAANGTCNKWLYAKDHNYESITTELNWVCDGAYQTAVGQSFFYIGSVIGTIVFGILADKYGRIPAFLLTSLAGGLGDFLTAFVTNLPLFTVCRFISGLSNDTFFMLMFILVFEYLKPEKRTFGLNIITATFYGTSLMLSPWLALFMGTWRKYLWVTSTPVILLAFYPLIISESARWLLTQQKYDRAVRCLKYVAKVNGREVDQVVFDEFINYYRQKVIDEKKLQDRNDTFLNMFRTPRLRKFTIILLIKSVIITMSYDIASRNMEGLSASPFLLFSITSICYVPGGLTLIFFQNLIGRKGMACISLLMGGLLTVITGFLIAFIDADAHLLLLMVMMALGRYGAIVAYDSEAQYATELIPTSVRGLAVSSIHVIGYACSFLNAYVIYLGTFYKPLPSILIGLLMLIGAILCLALPETQNRKLPDTLNEGELFGLNEKWYYFSFFHRKDIIANPKDNEGFEKDTIK